MSRVAAVIFAGLLGLNGLAVLPASLWWYDTVPGVIATGAFNPHFVRDIGMAYLVTAGGLGWFAARLEHGRIGSEVTVDGRSAAVLHAPLAG